jgi:hypothetical protein
MSKPTIRIVKRNGPVRQPVARAVIPIDREKARLNQRRSMTDAVENWISERRENSLAERVFSGRQIFAWNRLPDGSGKPA